MKTRWKKILLVSFVLASTSLFGDIDKFRKGTRKAEITPRDHLLLGNSENFDDSFLQNQYEFLYLCNHNVLADQMEFLSAKFSRHIQLIS